MTLIHYFEEAIVSCIVSTSVVIILNYQLLVMSHSVCSNSIDLENVDIAVQIASLFCMGARF